MKTILLQITVPDEFCAPYEGGNCKYFRSGLCCLGFIPINQQIIGETCFRRPPECLALQPTPKPES
jgi:hypothetical protein